MQKITFIQKFNAVEKSIESANLKTTAREFNKQPCQLRNWLKNYSKIKKHSLLGPGDKLPSLDRKVILTWLRNIWNEFPFSIVRNSFIESGHYYEDSIDYNGETESDFGLEN